jgi:hypothetical protein
MWLDHPQKYFDDERHSFVLVMESVAMDAQNGYLLQLFSKPVQDQPTVFLKSFSAKAQRILERAISKPYLKPSSGSRKAGAIYRVAKEIGLLWMGLGFRKKKFALY